MKLAKYIHELLLENETVIFPGFGAFISNYKPAEIKENEIIPPSKVISFTRQFRNDDGLLVTFIARKAKISQMYAQKRIDRERENMLYLLDKGENVTIENIGVLFNNEKNEIQFTPFQDENNLLDSFGFESVTVADSVEKPEVVIPSEYITEVVNEQVINGSEVIINSEKEVKPDFESSKPVIETETTVRTEITNENEKVFEISSEKGPEKIKLPDFKPAEINEIPVARKKHVWYWYVLILLLILVAGYFLFSKNNNQKKTEINDQSTINNQEQTQIQPVVPLDSLKNDSIHKLETVKEVNVKPESVTSIENSKYYLVGGGFKSEENAEKYILRLKEKGIEGIRLGKRGSMFLVGIESFNTEQEAYNALNRKVKENPEWKLWVYKK